MKGQKVEGTFELHDTEWKYHNEFSPFDPRSIEKIRDRLLFKGSYDQCYELFWKLWKQKFTHFLMILKSSTNEVVFPT